MHVHFNIGIESTHSAATNFYSRHNISYVIKCFTASPSLARSFISKTVHVSTMHLNAPKIVIKKANQKKHFCGQTKELEIVKEKKREKWQALPKEVNILCERAKN